jgi:lipopolysaccharide export system permease protein
MMKINSIINRYIFKEMLSPFVLSVLFFNFVFLMAEMIEITNWIVNYDVSVLAVLWMILYSTPLFMIFVIPMSSMMSILLTFLRMSGDNEITALKSGGLSVYGMMPPVIVLGLLGFAVTLFITIYAIPWSTLAIRELTYRVAASNVDIGLKERTFNDSFKDVMLYINKVDLKNKELIDIFIEDKRQEGMVSTVIAPRGKLFSEPDKFLYHLMLYNGTIHQTNLDDRMANSIGFKTYQLSLNLQDAFAPEKKQRRHRAEMSLGELVQYVKSFKTKDKNYYKALLDLHQKFSFPVACLALGLLALPLGLQSRTSKRSFGLVLGLLLVLVYYLMLSAGTVFGKTGRIPPAIGMWLPNAIMGAAGIYLLVNSARERSIRIYSVALYLQQIVVKRFRK